MLSVLENKLQDLPGSEKYQRICSHMEKLGWIYEKYENSVSLSTEELNFLCEFEHIGFTGQKTHELMKFF